jgi:hypothetical protein
MCGSTFFWGFLAHHQKLKTALATSGLPDQDQQRCYRHYPTVKPEAAMQL